MSQPSEVQLRRSAFTLVELLTVIGIIALLISILLPSLSRARVYSREIATLSNLRQIGLAVTMYGADHNGAWPTDLPPTNEDGRALTSLAFLAHEYRLPALLFINPNTTDTPATATDSAGWPIFADIAGAEINPTSPASIDLSNIESVKFHCSFSYDHEQKKSGRRFVSRVYLGDRADYAKHRAFSGNWGGSGMCLLWTDGHGEFVRSHTIPEQTDPNIYHHNQYYDDNGVYPGEGATETSNGVTTTPDTLDTHLRFFSEDEDDALLPNE